MAPKQDTVPKPEKAKAEAAAKARAEAEAKAKSEAEKAKAEAEEKAKVEAEAERLAAEAKANAELEAEAKALGIKKTRTSVAGARVKDKAVEQAKHDKKAMSRLRKDVAKAKAPPLSPEEARKKLLLARLNNPNNQYTREQIRQFKAELHAIKTDQWFPPRTEPDGTKVAWKVPERPSNYDRFMNS